jgi:hypothetical protein
VLPLKSTSCPSISCCVINSIEPLLPKVVSKSPGFIAAAGAGGANSVTIKVATRQVIICVLIAAKEGDHRVLTCF